MFCYTALKPFPTQNNHNTSHCMNAIKFYVHKITRNQIISFPVKDQFSCRTSHSKNTSENEAVNGMFTLYKVILIRVDVMDGDTNLKTYNLRKKNKNNGNDKRNQKLINLNCNYISSDQIYESNKSFKKYYFLNLN